jgi:hypothetical protein
MMGRIPAVRGLNRMTSALTVVPSKEPINTHLLLSMLVNVRPNKSDKSKAKAYADVTLVFDDGELKLVGFSVIDYGDRLCVYSPANRGISQWFPLIDLKGQLRQRIEAEIIRAYRSL